MSNNTRLLSGIALGAAIYVVGLRLIPRIGPIRDLIDGTVIGSGDVTQAVFFVLSMTLMLVLGKGSLSSFGFRGTPLKPLLRSVAIAAGAQLAMLIIMMVSMSVMGGPEGDPGGVGGEPGESPMFGSFLQTVISVWIVASTCEELLYRGLLYGYLQPLKERGFSLFGKHISLPVTACAVMFGLGHFCLWGIMPPVMVLNIVLACTVTGFVAGYFRETTGSIIPAIAVHMTANIVGFCIPALLMSAG